VKIDLVVNGRTEPLDVEPRTALADALRDDLGLTGTTLGCEHGVCGSCTVLLDGEPVRSCLVLAASADGASVTTVEGLSPDGDSPLQRAFSAEHALQCGFCTPGFLLLLTGELADDPHLDTSGHLEEVLSANVCRCTGYVGIRRAAVRAAREMRGETPQD
jgi:carbon-monoxide dehydrogenase small subunit